MDIDNPDFDFDGFVRQIIDYDCQQRFSQAIQDDEDEKKKTGARRVLKRLPPIRTASSYSSTHNPHF